MNLHKAELDDAERILEFYKIIIANSKSSQFNPKWNKNYPNLEFIKSSIIKEELLILNENENIIASIIVNNYFNKEYENLNWIVNAKYGEFAAIHALQFIQNIQGKELEKIYLTKLKTMH